MSRATGHNARPSPGKVRWDTESHESTDRWVQPSHSALVSVALTANHRPRPRSCPLPRKPNTSIRPPTHPAGICLLDTHCIWLVEVCHGCILPRPKEVVEEADFFPSIHAPFPGLGRQCRPRRLLRLASLLLPVPNAACQVKRRKRKKKDAPLGDSGGNRWPSHASNIPTYSSPLVNPTYSVFSTSACGGPRIPHWAPPGQSARRASRLPPTSHLGAPCFA